MSTYERLLEAIKQHSGMEGDKMRLHRDVEPTSICGGQVADARDLFNTDYWCVYCGRKWNDGEA